MSHYKPYPAYRDSGIEWIGQVPEHWEVKRLEYVVTTHRESVSSNDLASLEVLHYSIPAVQETGGGVVEDGATIDSNKLVVRCPQVLISKLNPRKNTVVIADADPKRLTVASTEFVPLLPQNGRTTLGFIASLASSSHLRQLLESRVESVTRSHQRVLPEDITKAILAIPPIDEQIAITFHLDRETTRIDSLIAKKALFIDLLKEKRQALITHAVTKGLDPSVRMKNSGVEWIGEVPEHWAVCKLSYRYFVELGKMLDEKRITGEHPVPYLRNKDVQWGEISTTDLPVMDISPDEVERYTIKNGDLLVCEGGDVGRAAIWRGDNNVIGFQKALHRLRTVSPDRDLVEFYAYALGAAKRNGVFEESDTKSTISHLPAEKFREYRFAFPLLNEQAAIVEALNRDAARIDLLTEKTQRSIDLLKERRAAFITAAVTGQIDLRESA